MGKMKAKAPDTPYEIPKEGSLGLLALGYRGLVAWRAVRGRDWVEERRREAEEMNKRIEAKKAESAKEEDGGAMKVEAASARVIPPAAILEKLTITVVSGLPRSGTSMMMQMLSAGGMEAFTDGAREADESNPRGYYEHAKVKSVAKDASWLRDADGLVVKVVAPLLRYLPHGPTYQVVFMERDTDEILQSQSTMLERDGRSSADKEVLKRAYQRQLAEAKAWCRSTGASLLEVEHGEALSNPAATAAAVNKHLGGRLREGAMAALVDPSLHREHA